MTISKEEIEACGWLPETILIDSEVLDKIADPEIMSKTIPANDGDVYIDGWSITKDDKTWWEMCRNSQRLLIVKKHYRNSVSQEWDMVMDAPIADEAELLNEMSWLGITGKQTNQ